MPQAKDKAITVKRQNFDAAMMSIKAFSDQAAKHKSIDKVSDSGGLFGLGNHKVTGVELNQMISQTEDQLIDAKNYIMELFDVTSSIYKALDALDKEHISGILIAANAARTASDTATKNVKSIEKIIKVLNDFKKRLEEQEHLMDADRMWDDLEELQVLIEDICAYQSELSQIDHLQDIDKLWEDAASHGKSLEGMEHKVSEINQKLNAHEKALQSTIASLAKKLQENQDKIDKKMEAFTLRESDKLNQMQTAQKEHLEMLKAEQTEAISQISVRQSEALTDMKQSQTACMDQLVKTQADGLDAIRGSLEEEKALLHETVTELALKVKLACALAGGATFIAAVQLLLNIVGVL